MLNKNESANLASEQRVGYGSPLFRFPDDDGIPFTAGVKSPFLGAFRKRFTFFAIYRFEFRFPQGWTCPEDPGECPQCFPFWPELLECLCL